MASMENALGANSGFRPCLNYLWPPVLPASHAENGQPLYGIASTVKVIPKLSEKLKKIENVFGDIASIEEQVTGLDELHSDVCDCLARLHSVSNRLDNIEGTTASLSESVDTLSRRVDEIEQRPSPTGVPPLDTRALDRIRQLQCALHASDLIITGLPEGHVNDHDQIISFCTVLDVAIDRTQILEVRRMRSTETTNNPQSLFLSVCSPSLRNSIFTAKRSNGPLNAKHVHPTYSSSSPNYVNEFLPAKVRSLLMMAKQVAREKQYRHVWTCGGSVNIEKTQNTPIIRITHTDQLDSLT
ncbi:uncharacterized protein [Neodiprion pinetum]|uniref:uncharacterized protein n=1 Tax=Neodiprion pinetum TaxID=441929 RepID=UPI001EDCF525|nr:uncharacterized protein LOC124217254 [Neodiprion pinetum]